MRPSWSGRRQLERDAACDLLDLLCIKGAGAAQKLGEQVPPADDHASDHPGPAVKQPHGCASARLSHLGFHAPLLLTDNPTTLPSDLASYFTMVSPSFLNTPADGPYNMTYVLGSWDQISWDQQVNVDSISEMHNRRVVGSDTGSTYADSQPGA